MTKRKRPVQLCLMCNGEGRVYRWTSAFEAAVIQAGGRSFPWTGSTHEWRRCRICDGRGVR